MNQTAYVLSLGLAVVFAWAGIAKLRAPRRTRRAFRALGVPDALAPVVPAAELVLALALIVVPRLGAPFAVAVLAAFSVVLARADEGAPCACFGRASSAPVTWVQQLRNAVLALVAAVASTATPAAPSIAAVLTAVGVGVVALLVLALADLKQRVGSTVMVRVR